MQRRMTALTVAALALLGLVAAACSDTVVQTSPGGEGISVAGTGRVMVEPDVGVLNLGIEVTARTVAQARGEAAEAMQEVRDSLAANGVEDSDIQTRFFNIFPQFRFEEREAPQIIGFTVNNQVEVKVRDIDRVSEILDDAIEAGGDAIRVNGISFQVDEPEQFLEEARALAMADALGRAEQLAELADVELGDAKSISESTGGGFPQPFRLEAVDTGFGGPTPISPGEGEVVLTVFVVYETK